MSYTRSMHRKDKKAVQATLNILKNLAKHYELTPSFKEVLVAEIAPGELIKIRHTAPFGLDRDMRYLVLVVTLEGEEVTELSFQYSAKTGAVADSTKFNKKGENTIGHIQCNYPGPVDVTKYMQRKQKLLSRAEGKWVKK